MEHLKPNPANSIPLTPLVFLERAARVYGDRTSIIYNATSYTWRQTHQRCLSLASFLSFNGIGKGHVVSVVAPNIPAMYELQFAVPMAGAILNNINTRLDAHSLSVLLSHAESKLVFVDILSWHLVSQAVSMISGKGKTPPKLVLITDEEVKQSSPLALTVDFMDTFEGIVSKGDQNFNWISPESEWNPMVLNYTSGTTASPKGVVHCHRGIFLVAFNSIIDWSVPNQPVYLWTLPMFHSNGWGFPYAIAAVGGTNICLRRIEPNITYQLIRQHEVTHMCAAPVVLNMLVSSPELLPKRVRFLAAGSPPPAKVLLQAEAQGFVVSHGYGLTETGGVVISCVWKPQWNRLPAIERARLKARQGVGSIGMTRVDVLDQDSRQGVNHDGSSVGEIVLQGGSVMLGYYKDPDATRKCIRDGWLYTGDVAVMHSDGYLEIKDRSKDVIISGGENISSVEVESVIYTHPDVKEAAVVARPDEFWGETPCAFVSLNKNKNNAISLSEKEMVEYCREKLPHYMVPKTVVFKDELPKTSTGKIQKFALREIAIAMGPPRTSRL